MRLEGKVSIVTGGGSGIGKATAARFIREGARVAILGVERDQMLAAAEEIGEVDRTVIPCIGDVRDEAFIRESVARAVRQWGRLTNVVCNAGVYETARIDEQSEEQWDRVLGINLKGMMLACKHAFPHLRRNGSGSIVNVSSIMGLTSSKTTAAYCATKAAIMGMTRAIAMDGAAFQIRANAVCPGTIDTPLYRNYVDAQPDPEAVHQHFNSLYPIGRIGTPEDVANLILFLSSDEASFITGAAYVIDGGYTIKGAND